MAPIEASKPDNRSVQAQHSNQALDLRIWKQQKLIDFLEESAEVDIPGLLQSYNTLAALQREAGNALEAEEALLAAQALQASAASFSIEPNTDVSASMATASSKGSGTSTTIPDAGKEPTLDFRRELISASGRPQSVHGRPASTSGVVSILPDIHAKPVSRQEPGERVFAAPFSSLDQRLQPSSEETVLQSVYDKIANFTSQLEASAASGRQHVQTSTEDGCNKVRSQVVTMLETRLHEENVRADNQTVSETGFIFWHAEALGEVERLLERQMAEVKQHLHQQVETERSSWVNAAQRHLDTVQREQGASEAALHVNVLLETYRVWDNQLLRWELTQLSDLQSFQGQVLHAWHGRARIQFDAEQAMLEIQYKASSQSFMSTAAETSTLKMEVGQGSPAQQRALAKLQEQLAVPPAHLQNQTDLLRLQRQIEEWKKVALHSIETQAEEEMERWKAEIDQAPSPRAKIQVIDAIEKRRLGAVPQVVEESFRQSVAASVISDDRMELAQQNEGLKRSQSMRTYGKEPSPKGKSLEKASSALQLDIPRDVPMPVVEALISPIVKNALTVPGPDVPVSVATEPMNTAVDNADPPLSAQDIERAVQEELSRVQWAKQVEMEVTIREQKAYLQAVVQQQREEAARNEEKRLRQEAEEEARRKKEAEEAAVREMEAEWARLQAVIAREKAEKLERLRVQQEQAEAKLGVRVKSVASAQNTVEAEGSGDHNDGLSKSKNKTKSNKNSGSKKAVASPSDSSLRTLPLGTSVSLTPGQKALGVTAMTVKQSGPAGVNVSVLAGMGFGMGASEAIFQSDLPKTEKLAQLAALAEQRDLAMSQRTASAYVQNGSVSVDATSSIGPHVYSRIVDGAQMALGSQSSTTSLTGALESAINPLAPSGPPAPHRYQKGDATALNTRVDPVIRFSRADREKAIPLMGVQPKGPGAGEAARLKAVRDSQVLMAMLDANKKEHLDSVATIYTEEQPKLVLGLKHTRSKQDSRNSPIRHKGSTNDYRAFTPDDRSPQGMERIRNTTADEFEDDGFDGMKLVKPAISPRTAALQSTRYDGRPDVSYMRPPDPKAEIAGTGLITRVGQYILDSKLPTEPGPLSPNASLYGNGAMSTIAYPHIDGNDGSIGHVTERMADASIASLGGIGIGGVVIPSQRSMSRGGSVDTAVSELISEEVREAQARRLAVMTEQQRVDFAAYHGPNVLQPDNVLGSRLEAASVLSTDSTKIGGSHGVKPMPTYANRPIRHLTATGTSSGGSVPRHGSPSSLVESEGPPTSPNARASPASFKCPHPGCNKTFGVAFELFNHANRSHNGITGDLARDPQNMQDYYFLHSKTQAQTNGVTLLPSTDVPVKKLSHANSPAYRALDPLRSGVAPQPLNPKAFVKKIRIPADQVIDRRPAAARKHAKTSSPTMRASGTYNSTADNTGIQPSPNRNTYYNPALMGPTLGNPDSSNARIEYGGANGGQVTNTFVNDSYKSLIEAKQRYIEEYNKGLAVQTATTQGVGSQIPTNMSPLSQFSPAVVSLSKKWEEAQQLAAWAEHTNTLKDWRRTYEKQLQLEARPLPTAALARRTREKFLPKTDPIAAANI